MKKENYFIKALNGMAYGFFCSLIIGTILKQLGNFINIPLLAVRRGRYRFTSPQNTGRNQRI